MQRQEFSNGGFVLHGIVGQVKNAKVSAWFDPAGKLLDAEVIYSDERTQTVRKFGLIWQELEKLGPLYMPVPPVMAEPTMSVAVITDNGDMLSKEMGVEEFFGFMKGVFGDG